MKSLVYAVVAASALTIPLASFAQTSNDGPVTRAQVRQDLIQLQRAGYSPAMRDPSYPEDVQAAEAQVHPQQGAAVASTGEASGYGGVTAGSSQSGTPMQVRPTTSGDQPIYFGR